MDRCKKVTIFLDDLQERSSSVGYGHLGRHGELGFEGDSVTVLDRKQQHALSMHPPRRGVAFAEYVINHEWSHFTASVAINDHNNFFGRAGGDLIFELIDIGMGSGTVGDRQIQRILWTSDPIRTTGKVQAVSVDISGVDVLRVAVRAPGSNACAHAVWVAPSLHRKRLPGEAPVGPGEGCDNEPPTSAVEVAGSIGLGSSATASISGV